MNAPTALLRLRVAPGASRSAIVGRHGESWKVRIAAAPERGRANDALVGLLAETLRLARSNVRLVSGAAARDKIVQVDGLTIEEAERRLAAAGRKEEQT
jgi:uncharacterized protein (TIGR00251 family)